MDTAALKAALGDEARRLGFSACGVTSVRPFDEARDRALAAIEAGRMDGMPWYTQDRVAASADIGGRYPWAQSIIALAWPYRPARPEPPAPSTAGVVRGRFSAYACTENGDGPVDYHELLARGCDDIVAWLRGRVVDVRAKRFIDHGWALDRAIAERAGIGFAGKHASVITLEAGSYVLLAGIAVSIALPFDKPSQRGCGRCTACLPSCPTGANRRSAAAAVAPHACRRAQPGRSLRRVSSTPGAASPTSPSSIVAPSLRSCVHSWERGRSAVTSARKPARSTIASPRSPWTSTPRRPRLVRCRIPTWSSVSSLPNPSSRRAFVARRSRGRGAPGWRETARSRSGMPGIERRSQGCEEARSAIRMRSCVRPLAGGSHN